MIAAIHFKAVSKYKS